MHHKIPSLITHSTLLLTWHHWDHVVAMSPKLPRNKDNQQIKTFSFLFIHFLESDSTTLEKFPAALVGEILSNPARCRAFNQTCWDNARYMDVLHGLVSLISKRTVRRMRETYLCQPIDCLTSFKNSQPYEKSVTQRSTQFPNSFPWCKPDGAHKEGLIGRFASVCALTRQLQNMLILHIMLQDHALDQIPN